MSRRKKAALGIGFSDSVAEARKLSGGKEKYRAISLEQSAELLLQPPDDEAVDEPVSSWRLVPILVVAFAFLCLIVGRLATLQIVQGATYKAQSDRNRLATKTVHAPRGIIYDRNKLPLVKNVPAFVQILKDRAEFVPYDEALQIEATNAAQTNLEVQAVRSYPETAVVAHILGYTSEISKEELAIQKGDKAYALGDRIGRAGIEQSYEEYLRGEDGVIYIENNAAANTKRQVSVKEPKEGKSLILNIDIALQRKMYQALADELSKLHVPAGAAVAQIPQTGEIIGLVSLPSYDNNIFSGRLSPAAYQDLLNNPSQPLFDRAIAGTYPPGSLYKIVTSIAGFLSGKLKASTQIVDTGVITLGQYKFPNWLWLSQGRTEGSLDVTRAIARSNDIFFYQVGDWIGPDLLAQTAKRLGMGKPTGIDLPGENKGLIPDREWKKKAKNEIWYPGDTYHAAIGQGDNLLTPMQLNMLTAFVANGGKAYQPQVVSKVVDSQGKTVREFEPKVAIENIISTQYLDLIRSGMKQACATGGTGWPFFNFAIRQYEKAPEATEAAQVIHPISVACKTGTAEYGDPGGKTHAWFTVYAPYDNPEVALTILIEGGGEGSNVSAPVAKDILEWYFKNKLQ